MTRFAQADFETNMKEFANHCYRSSPDATAGGKFTERNLNTKVDMDAQVERFVDTRDAKEAKLAGLTWLG